MAAGEERRTVRQAASFTLLGGACSRRGEQFVRWEPSSPQNSPKRLASSADCRTGRTTGAMWHTCRDADKEGDIGACAPIPILCSCEADCPRFATSPLPPWLTSERSREIGKCLRAASYLGFSQSCNFWKCGGNIALTVLTNIAGSMGETSETNLAAICQRNNISGISTKNFFHTDCSRPFVDHALHR